VDPLVLLDQADAQGKIPRPISRRVRLRMKFLLGAIRRTESASRLTYPPYYIEPVLPVARSQAEFGQMGVLFARVIPTTMTGQLSILVQFTAPLVIYGSKGTIEAVAAHEFTHYVDFVRRLSKTEIVAEDRSETLFESTFADSDRLVPPKLVFSEKSLVSLISRKFKGGLTDPALNKKVAESWIGKGLPMRWVDAAETRIKLSMDAVATARFDPKVIAKIQEIQMKTTP
jgi:hypothetical protein